MHASGEKKKVLPRILLLLYKLRFCLCAEPLSAESSGKQSRFYEEGGQRGVVAIAVIHLAADILQEEGERKGAQKPRE